MGAYFFDYLRNNQNQMKIGILERTIKDLIEEFRSLELNLSEQKKILNDYKYTLEKLDLEISRLADSNKGDSNITTAIQMANRGNTLEEIASATGLSSEEDRTYSKISWKVKSHILNVLFEQFNFLIIFLSLTSTKSLSF